jgi:hypothetical protein
VKIICLLDPAPLTEECVDVCIETVDFRLAPRRKYLCSGSICRCTIYGTCMCPVVLASGAPAELVGAICGHQTELIVKIGIS